VAQIREWITPGARVTEYYAGVGAIGLSVLDQVEWLRLNEVSPQSLQGLQLGLAQLPAPLRAKVEVLPGAAGAALEAARDAQLVIVDPPRKGLDAALTQRLATCPPEQLIYISCGLPSFQHDLGLLLAGGRLQLAELRTYNLMPFTEHVETVARFRAV
jgi:tRNA/tmRNA/rRNA uracil-C5-methylase (TrmA/RlmC/RlmD family)